MKRQKYPEGKFMATVKIGPEGQIVIPKEVRDIFGIECGDSLILLADKKRGIALDKYNVLKPVMDAIFAAQGDADDTENEAAEDEDDYE